MTHWIARLKNGEIINENDNEWPKNGENVVQVLLSLNNGKTISTPIGMDKYLQAKTASANLNGSSITIESRYIGYIYRNILTRIRVDESNDNITLENQLI